MFVDLSTFGWNIYGYAVQYRCTTELYLLSILSHDYDIIIDRGVGSPIRGQYIGGNINATYKRFIPMLMANFNMSGYKGYDNHMEIQTTTQK